MAELTTIDSVSSGDLVVVWSGSNSPPYYGASINTIAEAVEPLLTQPGQYTTQYSAPAATGFTTTVTAGSTGQDDVRLIITPGGAYANGTIVLPLASTCIDHQKLLVTCTQAVTTLAITLNGAVSAPGAPTTLAANAFFMLMFDQPTLNWYRVG